MIKFRLLEAEDIECKISHYCESGGNLTGLNLLLYKTARTDMDLLDETVGPENWQDDYKEIKGNLYCGIGVRSAEDKPFIWKWNCGIESRADGDGNEKKGEASDAMKRAGFCWGIGRELYTSPRIYIPVKFFEVKQARNGKYITCDHFEVEKVAYDDRRHMSGLSIRNESSGQRCFVWVSKKENKNG